MLYRLIGVVTLGLLVGGNLSAQQIPVIAAQPSQTAVVFAGNVSQTLNQVVPLGSTILLDAGAQGEGLSYQWTLNGDPIDGATNSTLTLSNASVPTGGSYVVNVYNQFGSVASQRAVVRMNSPQLTLSDNFADAASITNTAGTGWDYYWEATREDGEPEHAGLPGIQSKWLTWVAPADGVATLQTFGSSFDTVLAVYTGESVSNLTEVDSDGDLWGHQGSFVMFNAQAGIAYRIAAGGFMKSGIENLVLSWNLVPTTYPLPAVLQQSQSQTASQGATITLSVDYSSDAPLSLQWYHDGQPILNANQATLQLSDMTVNDLGVYSVALISSEWTYFLKPIEIQFNTEGNTAAAARHKINACLNSPLIGAVTTARNTGVRANLIQSVQTLGLIVPQLTGYEGSQLFETYPGKDPDEPNICGIAGGASYWFSYVPSQNGTFFLNTIGSSFDTLLGVFVDDGTENGYASLIQVACDDNSGDGVQTSALQLPVTNGVTYYLMLDGKNGATGTVDLNYHFDRMPTISGIATQAIDEEQSAGPINFTIGDNETDPASLQVFGASTNQSLVTNSAIVFGGTGANRTVTITPTPYVYGTNTLTISVMDAAGNISSTNFQLQVRKINHAPIAVTDSYTRLTNSSITIAISAILRNDTDIDGNTITLTGVSPKSQSGNAHVVKALGKITYTPDLGYNSQDFFTYTISDGQGGGATGVVYISVGADGQTMVY